MSEMYHTGIKAFSLWLAAILLPLAAHADDVQDSIREALDYYNAGDYQEAVESLDYASQLIRQMKGKKLETLLPAPLEGWSAKPAESRAVGAAVFGGGLTVERSYTRGPASVTIRIVADSPMIQGMLAMFSNPVFATSDGGRLERIGREKAIVKYDAASKSGDIRLAVANRFLVTIEGTAVTEEDLKAYARAIDFKKLKGQ